MLWYIPVSCLIFSCIFAVLDIPVNCNLIYCLFQAVSYQKKAVIVCERIFGVDHPDTIIAYVSSCYHEGSTLSHCSYVLGYFWKWGFFLSVLAFCYFTHKDWFWAPRTHQAFKNGFQNVVFLNVSLPFLCGWMKTEVFKY